MFDRDSPFLFINYPFQPPREKIKSPSEAIFN